MFKINPDTVFRKEFDGTTILFNPDTGKMFSLNSMAQVIYTMLEAGASETEIMAALQQKLPKLPENAALTVAIFIAELQEYDFIR